MIAHASIFLLSLVLAGPTQCPDNGDTTFFDGGKGFQGFRLLGANSYRSFFVGRSFRKATADAPGQPGRVMFWVDRLMVQWQLVETRVFQPNRSPSDRETLRAHLEYEHGYLKTLAEQGKLKVANLKVFEPIEKKGGDGKERLFQIWQATTGNRLEGTQFWVTTTNSQGVVVMAIIAPSQEDVGAAKAIIDSYMHNYGPVDELGCKRLQEDASKGGGSLH